jgi:hypothetical protein
MSARRKTAATALLGAFISTLPASAQTTPAASTGKQVIPLTQYFAMEQDRPTETHLKFTPFPQQMVRVSVDSTTHGRIQINFNCHTFKPKWNDKNKDGVINNDEVVMIPTMGVIAATHAGLGNLNLTDAPSVKTAMIELAKNVAWPTPEVLDATSGDDHLDKVHGFKLFYIHKQMVEGQLKRVTSPGPQMIPIRHGCLALLESQTRPLPKP